VTTAEASPYRWAILAVCVLGFMQTHVHRVGFAPLIPTFIADMGLSYAAAGTIMAAYFWTYALMQVPVGVLTDRLGPRRVMLACMGVMAVGALAFAVAHTWTQSLLARCVVGAGVAATWLPGLRLIHEWFPLRERGLATGLFSAGGGAGGTPRSCSCPSWPSISAGAWATPCSRCRCWSRWARCGRSWVPRRGSATRRRRTRLRGPRVASPRACATC
jgi:MFS family permease